MNGTSVNNHMHHTVAGNLSVHFPKLLFTKLFSFVQYRILDKGRGLLILTADFQNSK